MTPPPFLLALLVATAFSIACSKRPTEPSQPAIQAPTFMTLEVSPSSLRVNQGSSVQLEVLARDQYGVLMTGGSDHPTFSSSNPAIAYVSGYDGYGVATGVGPGTADILVTKKIAGVTRRAEVKATIEAAVLPANVTITSRAQTGWQPSNVVVARGGTITWFTTADVPHRTLYLLKGGNVVDSLDLRKGAAALTVEDQGTVWYCSGACWDPHEYGVFHVP